MKQINSIKPATFEYKKETVMVEQMIVNHSESLSSVSDTAVSEGSLIAQNLPKSKILYATKKDEEHILSLGRSKRKNYTIKE